MASHKTRPEDQLAYDSTLSSAPEQAARPTSTCFSPAANRHHPRGYAPESSSDPFCFVGAPDLTVDHTLDLPSLSQTAISFSRPVQSPPELSDALPSVTEDPFFRRYLGARHLPRLFNRPISSTSPMRNVDVNAAQHWPSRRDSLRTNISGVRCQKPPPVFGVEKGEE